MHSMYFLRFYRKRPTGWHTKYNIMGAGKELSSANSSRDARHNGHSIEKNRNYRHALHCVNIFPPHSLPFYPVFFFVAKWFRERNSFFTVRRFNSRIRYSIGRAVVDLIEHKGFRYSSNAICNRATYPIKSSYAVDCTPTRRQTLDKFYSLLLHSCIDDFFLYCYVPLKFIHDVFCICSCILHLYLCIWNFNSIYIEFIIIIIPKRLVEIWTRNIHI